MISIKCGQIETPGVICQKYILLQDSSISPVVTSSGPTMRGPSEDSCENNRRAAVSWYLLQPHRTDPSAVIRQEAAIFGTQESQPHHPHT